MNKTLGSILLLGIFWAGVANGSIIASDGSSGVTVVEEHQNYTLNSSLSVRLGFYDGYGTSTIQGGETINSYLVRAEGNGTKYVSLTFTDTILGLIYNTNDLENTHYLSLSNDSASSYGYSSSEVNTGSSTQDLFFIFDDNFMGTFKLTGGRDDVRVITASSPAPVPVPAALWLFGSGLLAFVGFGKLRRKEISAAA